jgi:hypothetical protein
VPGPQNDTDLKSRDPADDPGLPRAVVLMLAPMFLVGGLVSLSFGKMEGGVLLLLLSCFALVSGLVLRFAASSRGTGDGVDSGGE